MECYYTQGAYLAQWKEYSLPTHPFAWDRLEIQQLRLEFFNELHNPDSN